MDSTHELEPLPGRYTPEQALYAYSSQPASVGFGQLPRDQAEAWAAAIEENNHLRPDQTHTLGWMLIETAFRCQMDGDQQAARHHFGRACEQLTTLNNRLDQDTSMQLSGRPIHSSINAAAMSVDEWAELRAKTLDVVASLPIFGYMWGLSTAADAAWRLDTFARIQATAADVLLRAYSMTDSPDLLHSIHSMTFELTVNLCKRFYDTHPKLLPSQPGNRAWAAGFVVPTPPRLRGEGKSGYDLIWTVATEDGTIVHAPVRVSAYPDPGSTEALVVNPSIYANDQINGTHAGQGLLAIVTQIARTPDFRLSTEPQIRHLLRSIKQPLVAIQHLLSATLAAPQEDDDNHGPTGNAQDGIAPVTAPTEYAPPDAIRLWRAAQAQLASLPARDPFGADGAIRTIEAAVAISLQAERMPSFRFADRLDQAWQVASLGKHYRDTEQLQQAIHASNALAKQSLGRRDLPGYIDAYFARSWAVFYHDRYSGDRNTAAMAATRYRQAMVRLIQNIIDRPPGVISGPRLQSAIRQQLLHVGTLLAVSYDPASSTPEIGVILASPYEHGARKDPHSIDACVVCPAFDERPNPNIGYLRFATTPNHRHAAADRGIHTIVLNDVFPKWRPPIDTLRALSAPPPNPIVPTTSHQDHYLDQWGRVGPQHISRAIGYAAY